MWWVCSVMRARRSRQLVCRLILILQRGCWCRWWQVACGWGCVECIRRCMEVRINERGQERQAFFSCHACQSLRKFPQKTGLIWLVNHGAEDLVGAYVRNSRRMMR